MLKNRAWFRIGFAIFVMMFSYISLQVDYSDLATIWKLSIACAIAVLALIITFASGRNSLKPSILPKIISIGKGIKSKANISIKKIRIEPPNGDEISVGCKLKAGKDVDIEDIQIGSGGEKNGKA